MARRDAFIHAQDGGEKRDLSWACEIGLRVAKAAGTPCEKHLIAVGGLMM